MKFMFNVSPNLRQKQSTKRIMFELMLGLLVVFGFSLIYYGSVYGSSYVMQAFVLLGVSLLTTFLSESVFAYFTRGKNKFDLAYLKKFLGGSFGWITAIILTMMCPISIPPYALIIATFFAIFFGKLVFGGFGNNIFNPAALGRAVIFATFMGAATDVITVATPTGIIATNYNWLVNDARMVGEMINAAGGMKALALGWYPGAIGETSAIVILLVGAFLVYRKVIDWRVPAVYLGGIAVLTSIVAIMRGVPGYEWLPGFIWYPIFHLITGGVMFGAIFMLTDPVTSPTSAQGRTIFALGAAILTVLIRIKANLPEGCLYSILIMNMLTPMIERALEGKQLQLKKKATIMLCVISLFGIGATALCANVIEPAYREIVIVSETDEVAKQVAETATMQETETSYIFEVDAVGYKGQHDPTMMNTFAIEIDKEKGTIVEVKVLKIVDTEGIGDKLYNADFLKQFVGKGISADLSIEMDDTVSGATYSTKSLLRALMEVRNEMEYIKE